MPKRILPPLKIPPIHETPEYRNLVRHLLSEHNEDDKDLEDFKEMIRDRTLSDTERGFDPVYSLEIYHNSEHDWDNRIFTPILDHTHADE